MTNVLLDGFSNYWHRRKSSMKNHTRGETTSVARLSATPQHPEPLERNRRTIPLNFKGAENQQEFSRDAKYFLLTFLLIEPLQASATWNVSRQPDSERRRFEALVPVIFE
jgi:hypothetical protein